MIMKMKVIPLRKKDQIHFHVSHFVVIIALALQTKPKLMVPAVVQKRGRLLMPRHSLFSELLRDVIHLLIILGGVVSEEIVRVIKRIDPDGMGRELLRTPPATVQTQNHEMPLVKCVGPDVEMSAGKPRGDLAARIMFDAVFLKECAASKTALPNPLKATGGAPPIPHSAKDGTADSWGHKGSQLP